MPETTWLLYAENAPAPLCRKVIGSYVPEDDTSVLPRFRTGVLAGERFVPGPHRYNLCLTDRPRGRLDLPFISPFFYQPGVTMSTGPEIRPLTGLRGIAALYVMAYHYTIGLGYSSHAATLMSHGYLAVDLFFCLSGFVMAISYAHMFEGSWTRTKYFRFIGRRIARVYPLYLVATLAAFVLILAGGLAAPASSPLTLVRNVVLNLTMTQTWGFADSFDGASWSLSAEWAAYLIFPILLVPTLQRRPSVAWLTVGACMAIVALLPALKGFAGDRNEAHALLDIFEPNLALPVLRCIAEFTMGLVAYRIASTRAGRWLSHSRWAAPAVLTVMIAMLTVADADAAIVTMFVACLIAMSSESNGPARWLSSPLPQLAGRLSYGIYLTHLLFSGLVSATYARAQALGLTHAHTYGAVAGILATLIASSLLYANVEVPARRALRHLFDRWNSTYLAVGSAPHVRTQD